MSGPYQKHDATSTTIYPVYASKAALMTDLERAFRGRCPQELNDVLQRLSNTTTSNWADPSATGRP